MGVVLGIPATATFLALGLFLVERDISQSQFRNWGLVARFSEQAVFLWVKGGIPSVVLMTV